jgi:hypothetical protein
LTGGPAARGGERSWLAGPCIVLLIKIISFFAMILRAMRPPILSIAIDNILTFEPVTCGGAMVPTALIQKEIATRLTAGDVKGG